MKFYNAKIQLGSNVLHEVIKNNLSAAEIVLLRRIHGEAAVIDIEPTKAPAVPEALGGDTWNDRTVRQYLRNMYGVEGDTKVDRVIATFGVDGVPLPQEVEASDPGERLDETTIEKIRAEERAKLEAEFAVRERKAEEMPAAAVVKENEAAGLDKDAGLLTASELERKAAAEEAAKAATAEAADRAKAEKAAAAKAAKEALK